MKNRYGQDVFTGNLTRVEEHDTSYSLTKGEGYIFGVNKSELGNFVPEVGDFVVLYTTNFSFIQGIIIEGTVVRYRTAEQVEEERKRRSDAWRLEKVERYLKTKDEMQRRVKALPMPLRERMWRFGEEGGTEFWIESADYEIYALEGAAALLRKVDALAPDERIQWIEDWWKINSAEHDPPYDYKKQMEMVPDFGDGHSGNTAGAAKALAVAVLQGKEV